MRIAVSGTTGLIGFAVANALSLQHEVLAVGRRIDSQIPCDFSDVRSVRALNLSDIDAIIHCAGIVDEDFIENPTRAFESATQGMAEFVSQARAASVRRFAYVSSAHVYGHLNGKINENNAPNPLSDYALAHFVAEQILKRATSSSFQAGVFRPCAVFGLPKDPATFRRWSLIPFDFPRTAVNESKIVLRSCGDQRRNFVGTADIARSIATWLERSDNPDFFLVNPVGKDSMSVWEFAKLCAELAGDVTRHPIFMSRVEANPVGAQLDYESVYPEHHGDQDLRGVTTDLIKLLFDRKN
jgi:UDP-glucose 4-epimerase